MSLGWSAVVVLVLSWIYSLVYRSYKRISVKDIQGPSYSWLLGNELDLWWQEQVGEVDFKWMEKYGNVWRVGGCFGEDVLMVADPKALQYIFQGYNFPKRADFRQTIRLLTGTGLLYAEGADHHRQKRIMDPAFGPAQLRSFFPIFRRKAAKLSYRLKEGMQASSGKVINVASWMAHTTLDIIGEAAFDYAFDTLDDGRTELASAYHNLFIESVTFPPRAALLFKALWCYVPECILPWVEHLPAQQLNIFRKYMKVARTVARELLAEKAEYLTATKGQNKKDVMSILVKANASQDSKSNMSEFEMVSQMTTLMLAGHETTASSMNWILMELARHPEYQNLIREEIRRVRSEVVARGDEDFSMADLENMPYLTAAIKETLRYHPIAYHLVKKAAHDDVIPLSKPIKTKSGKMISEIPVGKDQSIIVSVCAYNRCADVWGEDAHVWNPYRYFDQAKLQNQTTVGVYGNVLTFSSGTRSCIGWRFSVIELHAIAVEILENFELTFPDDVNIRRVPAIAMTCMVDGELEKGVQMPLYVTPVV